MASNKSQTSFRKQVAPRKFFKPVDYFEQRFVEKPSTGNSSDIQNKTSVDKPVFVLTCVVNVTPGHELTSIQNQM